MHGSLFTQDFLDQGICGSAAWLDIDPAQFAAFAAELQRIHARVSGDTQLNEAQTEAELITPVLQALGWHLLPQQQTNARGRSDVPDALLFTSAEPRQAALEEPRPDRRYRHGGAIVESKRWSRPLDRGNAGNRIERDDAAYILDTFPIVRAADEAAFGRYRTRELVLAYMHAIAAGDIDSVVAH